MSTSRASIQVWFITGVSSGFGLELSLYALSQGHEVYGTVRDRSRAAESVSKIEGAGGKCVVLDVDDLNAIPQVVDRIVKEAGRIDVLVNNAAYSLYSGGESSDGNQFLWAVAVLPGMRERNSGTIVNISSTTGIYALPSLGLYSASKFALEGLSESLRAEVSDFNIAVLIVEPSAFRTNFSHSATCIQTPLSQAYKDTAVGKTLARLDAIKEKAPSDPAKTAKVIFDAVVNTGDEKKLAGDITRLPLGSDAVKRVEMKVESLQKDLEKTRRVAVTTNLEGGTSVI